MRSILRAIGSRPLELSTAAAQEGPVAERKHAPLRRLRLTRERGLGAHKTLEPQVCSLRWNAQESLALAASLEVGQRLNVRYRGVSYDVQIVSIAHDI